MPKKKVEKPKKVKEEKVKITDILEEYFWDEEKGCEMVKRTYMNGDKKIKEDVSIH